MEHSCHPRRKLLFQSHRESRYGNCRSGDVLTGILAALLAQGYTQEDACRLGVYVHGLAGDIAAEEKGEIGTTSSDLIDALPAAWKKLTETKGRFTKE